MTIYRGSLVAAAALAVFGCGSSMDEGGSQPGGVAGTGDQGGVTHIGAGGTGGTGGGGTCSAAAADLHEPALRFSEQQLLHATTYLGKTQHARSISPTGKWNSKARTDWTSGFYTGAMWQMFDDTGDPAWKMRAADQMADLVPEETNGATEDLGFKIFGSFGQAYRLTSDASYKQVVLKAATTLATRYSETVGCFQTFPITGFDFPVIIDHMMNLELMVWAAANGGDPHFRDMAVRHATNTMQNHVRPDGSTYHVVAYNPSNGQVVFRGTKQGAADDSTWARGQAWAIYGFTMMFRETQMMPFFHTARKAADWYLASLPPDHVPYWDFSKVGEERDTSAAAVAASGLLELAHLVTDPAAAACYRAAAQATLDSLSKAPYLAQGQQGDSTLLHAVGSKPGGTEIDVGIIYGDYYFNEALLRLRRWPAPASLH